MTKDEEILLRELAGGRCTIQKVTDAIGPMSLWSKDGLEEEIRRAVEAELEHEIKRMREEMKIKSVTMRCKDYDVALPIIYNDFGRVLVGQVSITPKPKEPEQEPVAWMDKDGDVLSASVIDGNGLRNIPLYTTPPQRKWQGLTDEEIASLHYKIKVQLMGAYKTEDIYRTIEEKLKEKNT